MITRDKMDACLGRLGMLKRFPVQERTQVQIGKLLNELCSSDDEAEQLVTRVLDEHSEWPGPSALREMHGQVSNARWAKGRPEGCENCRGRDGRRTVFKIIDLRTGGEETILPEGSEQAVWALRNKLVDQYAGSKTHQFYDSMLTFCSCPAGVYAAAENRRLRERAERRYGG